MILIHTLRSERPGWDVVEKGFQIHVLPVQDLLAHQEEDTCACQPAVETINNDDGDVLPYALITHAAWDGRE